MRKFTIKLVFLFFTFYIVHFTFYISTTFAIVDPLLVPNNRFGIHIIQATPQESSPAADLVNTNGDWGYITVLVESKDRNHNKWQEFFNALRRRHLIPLVRLATQPENGHWKLPYEGEEIAWADFLDKLNWPTKNRYIIIYNEPNHAAEWGNKVDATSYAKVLDKTITALKNKNGDFFVLNAGLDASTPYQPPLYMDEVSFLKQMEQAVPGILNRLDGWVSHSYPNPNFTGSPDDYGKGTVWTWEWEQEILESFGAKKKLPIFITETGWKHAEGLKPNKSYPSVEKVASYYQKAFTQCWNNPQIVAVTPFLLNYQEPPFDQFSFKKHETKLAKSETQSIDDPYFPAYRVLQDFPKASGRPVQEVKAELLKGEIFTSIVAGEAYMIDLTFKNIGQSIWNDREQVRLVATEGGQNFGITNLELPKNIKVEPGQEYTFRLNLKAPLEMSARQNNVYKTTLNLFEGNRQFDSKPLESETEVKSPVILKIKSSLGWKNNFAGNYILTIKGATGSNIQNIKLDGRGMSDAIEARYLLPDYSFEFSLEKPFYKPSKITQTVSAGENTLNFGSLKPDIFSVLLNPKELWKLLPFSN